MACPSCEYPIAIILAPVFRFRRRRWFDRFFHPADSLRVPGITKLWAGFDCMCAKPSCAANYRINGRGSSLMSSRRSAPAPDLDKPDEGDDEVLGQIPLDSDLILPGERTR